MSLPSPHTHASARTRLIPSLSPSTRRLFFATNAQSFAREILPMSQTVSRVCLFFGLLITASVTAVRANVLPDFVSRGGLPHFHTRASAGEPLRVAFLGGSITVAQGWRVHVLEQLRATYPQADITELFAAISNTDSAYGACRLSNDVLARRPDLLFVEFAVNDTGAEPGRIRAAMEGIVLQTLRANPATELCFVYTLSQSQLPDYQAGRLAVTARAMDEIAAHYGIPSVAVGPEVVRRLVAGKLLFRGPSAGLDPEGNDADGRLVLTGDGIHPLAGGHRLYFSVIEPALRDFLAADPAAAPRALPTPLTPEPWTRAAILPVAELERVGDWAPLPATDRRARVHPAPIMPMIWLAPEAGASLSFGFTGTTFGLVGLKGPDCGQFNVVVDDLPPVTATFFDAYSVENRHHLTTWHYPRPLPDGPHRVRIELLDTSPDKIGILARRNYTPRDPAAFAPLHLYLGGVLLPQGPPPHSSTP